jgi:hypothetical protein
VFHNELTSHLKVQISLHFIPVLNDFLRPHELQLGKGADRTKDVIFDSYRPSIGSTEVLAIALMLNCP